MIWQPPQPHYHHAGITWRVHRSWHDKKPGNYLLELIHPEVAGVRGALLSQGQLSLMPADDPRLPSLKDEAGNGVLMSYRPMMRAIIRADGRYIKVFRPGAALVPAERCAQMQALLDPAVFVSPPVLRSTDDVIDFGVLPGRTLGGIGEDNLTVSEETFSGAWDRWARAWTAQVSTPADPVRRRVLATLPAHTPESEAANIERWLNRWLRHTEGIEELAARRALLQARAEAVTANLFRTDPDPLVWGHGDLHDKQVLVSPHTPLGMLDFDDAARAEAARDLAILDVHLDLRRRRHSLSPPRYRRAHAHVLAVANQLDVTPERFETYSDACWLRLACASLPSRTALALGVLDERAGRRHAVNYSSAEATDTRS